MKHLKYLSYVLRHKLYVAIECFRDGLYWQGITHDLSKLLPSEFIPYTNHFYGKKGDDIKKGRDETGYYKPTDTGDKAFDFAWLLHQKRNNHHWQWWILPEDDGGIKILEMPDIVIKEMICDWVGAGKAQGFVSPKGDRFYETKRWYEKNKSKMNLHYMTRLKIESIIYDSPILPCEIKECSWNKRCFCTDIHRHGKRCE